MTARLRLLALLLLTAGLSATLSSGTALAQDKPVPEAPPEPAPPPGYERLDDELRSEPSTAMILERGLEEMSRAVQAQRFDRADSLLTLLNARAGTAPGASDGRLWPTPGIYVAVRLLAGQPGVLRRFEADEWPRTLALRGVYDRSYQYRPLRGGPLVAPAPYSTALVQSSARIEGQLRQRGGTEAEADFAMILAAWLTRPLTSLWAASAPPLSPEQETLNEAIDAHLDAHPNSPYRDFLREEVWVQYDWENEFVGQFELGDGAVGAGGLGGRADGALASGGFGFAYRAAYWHAAVNLRLTGIETAPGFNGDGEPVTADRAHLLGEVHLTAGPRASVPVGRMRVDLLPFAGVGIANLSEAREQDFEPAYNVTRPVLVYGGQVSVRLPASGTGLVAVFVRGSRTEGDFGGDVAGPGSLTVGVEFGGASFSRRRHPTAPRVPAAPK